MPSTQTRKRPRGSQPAAEQSQQSDKVLAEDSQHLPAIIDAVCNESADSRERREAAVQLAAELRRSGTAHSQLKDTVSQHAERLCSAAHEARDCALAMLLMGDVLGPLTQCKPKRARRADAALKAVFGAEAAAAWRSLSDSDAEEPRFSSAVFDWVRRHTACGKSAHLLKAAWQPERYGEDTLPEDSAGERERKIHFRLAGCRWAEIGDDSVLLPNPHASLPWPQNAIQGQIALPYTSMTKMRIRGSCNIVELQASCDVMPNPDSKGRVALALEPSGDINEFADALRQASYTAHGREPPPLEVPLKRGSGGSAAGQPGAKRQRTAQSGEAPAAERAKSPPPRAGTTGARRGAAKQLTRRRLLERLEERAPEDADGSPPRGNPRRTASGCERSRAAAAAAGCGGEPAEGLDEGGDLAEIMDALKRKAIHMCSSRKAKEVVTACHRDVQARVDVFKGETTALSRAAEEASEAQLAKLSAARAAASRLAARRRKIETEHAQLSKKLGDGIEDLLNAVEAAEADASAAASVTREHSDQGLADLKTEFDAQMKELLGMCHEAAQPREQLERVLRTFTEALGDVQVEPGAGDGAAE
eukprot:TRINITY_DN17945_c0_g1_i1.p1 TRINITY_DN17945_c0_g1~~TRINITY_DN17945_c0_g1_i1.p1  ORF type:complete len:618 (+),score=128.45 TRINITY_DN17945_c0_g1_i1:87-1856(+)